ncbi:YdcF family protein [Aerophototrophica crusticola]|uniref:YdcF family protein n=1 Tax=Aerophototrophica crusticola TaxID=1709002 RepID=A0A858R357_9PROT|nr:YdcF family protein [Rhodospirillaceae bacterium B3]
MSPTPSAVRLRLAVRRVRIATRRTLAVLAAIVGVWLAGLFVFVASLPRNPPADGVTTDAIVVLTGGSERLGVGFALLRDGRAKKLFISGVYRGVEVRELLDRARQGEDLECCVVLGYEADDTEGNAVETARWVRAEGYRSLRLVTANYHMPRSLVEFRRALPDVEVVPHPVVPPRVRLERWWNWPGTAELVVGEYNKFLLAYLRATLTRPPAAGGGV